MKVKFSVLVLLFLSLPFSGHSQRKLKTFFKKADLFFSAYVKDGYVDYLSLKKDPLPIKTLVQQISGIGLSRTRRKKAKAFYINAYNVLLIDHIVTDYPAFSPLEERGLFSLKRNLINGEWKTLNELEKIIFEKYKDIKLYAVLSSCTEGSPPLSNFAYKPRRLNHKLKERLKFAVNNPDYIRVKSKSSLILFCEAFKDFRYFFEDKDLIRYVNKFRSEDLPLNYKLGFYPGKRSLNVKIN
jgi:hypothetical protein